MYALRLCALTYQFTGSPASLSSTGLTEKSTVRIAIRLRLQGGFQTAPDMTATAGFSGSADDNLPCVRGLIPCRNIVEAGIGSLPTEAFVILVNSLKVHPVVSFSHSMLKCSSWLSDRSERRQQQTQRRVYVLSCNDILNGPPSVNHVIPGVPWKLKA